MVAGGAGSAGAAEVLVLVSPFKIADMSPPELRPAGAAGSEEIREVWSTPIETNMRWPPPPAGGRLGRSTTGAVATALLEDDEEEEVLEAPAALAPASRGRAEAVTTTESL